MPLQEPNQEATPANYFQWNTQIELGHTEIDAQHKELFRLGAAVVDSLDDPAEHKLSAAQLQAFITSAKEHFKYEENLMREAAYPEAERHAKYHASLLTELLTNYGKMHWGHTSDTEGLIDFLWNWLILHIGIADREMTVWLKPSASD